MSNQSLEEILVMRSLTFVLLALTLAAGCGKKSEDAPAGQPSVAGGGTSSASIKAEEIFKQQCSTCHGEDGKGAGAAAATLNPKPRNYTDKTWQASVTDDQIKKVIVEGGAANGKSPSMAPYGFLFKDDPAALDELVKKIRAFGK
jgi:mono/diheme cytochrome c family protein